jgi:hypothetical protein
MNLTPIIEQMQRENRENWSKSSGITTVDYMDTLISNTAHAVHEATVAEVVRIIKEQVNKINGEYSVFDDFANDIITALIDQKIDSGFPHPYGNPEGVYGNSHTANLNQVGTNLTDQKITKEDNE